MFFVISGYLMTSTIWSGVSGLLEKPDADNKPGKAARSFAFLAAFYARRIRRLAPAATVCLLGILLAVTLMQDFSLQLATAPQVFASSVFIQNWFLAFQSVDYLGADAGATAVQHFWSLSVEEQFYMIWPLFILIAGIIACAFVSSSKKLRTLLLIIVTAFTAASFIYGLYKTNSSPAEAYFVTPARIWELSLGGILVFLPTAKRPKIQHSEEKVQNEPFPKTSVPEHKGSILPWLGLALIGFSFVAWDGAGSFPGWFALIPTFGTALVILFGESGGFTYVSRLRPAQFFGDISYSLYLWHWPLIILAPAILGVDLNHDARALKLVLFAAGVLIAWLSYRFVENPLRRFSLKRAQTFKVFALGAVCLALVLIPANLIETRAADFSENIKAMAFQRATDPDDIGFGARATLHRGEQGVPENPYGQVDPKWAQFATASVHGTMTSQGKGADTTASISYSCSNDSKTKTDLTGEFGDTGSNKTILVLGDSFSKQWYPAIDVAAQELGYKVVAANSIYINGSLFEVGDEFGDLFTSGGQQISVVRSDERFRWIRDNLWGQADIILIGVSPHCFYQVGSGPQDLLDSPERFASTLREMSSSTDATVVLIQSPPPILDYNDRTAYLDKVDEVSPGDGVYEHMNMLNRKLVELGAGGYYTYLDVSQLFLDDDGDAHTQIGGVPVYFDAWHINTLYSASAGEFFARQLKAIGATASDGAVASDVPARE